MTALLDGLKIILALGVFLQAGIMFLALIRARDLIWIEWLTLGFGLGVGLVTMQMLIMSLVGIPFLLWVIGTPWALAWAYLLRNARLSIQTPFIDFAHWRASVRTSRAWGGTLLTVALLTVIVTVLSRATFFPLFEWDSWAIWDLKARAFLYQAGIVPFINDAYYALSHLDYPLLYPLSGTFLYMVFGRPTSQVLLIPGLFYAALLGMFYVALRRQTTPRIVSLILTLGLACTPNLLFWSTQFYAEIPLVYYTLTGAICLSLYLRERRWHWLVISGFMLGFAAQTKIEGFFFVIPGLLILTLQAGREFKSARSWRGWASLGVFAAAVGIISAPWFVFRQFVAPYTITVSLESGSRVIQNLSRLPSVISTLLAWMGQPASQNMFFLVFPVTFGLILINWRRWREWAFAQAILQATSDTLTDFMK